MIRRSVVATFLILCYVFIGVAIGQRLTAPDYQLKELERRVDRLESENGDVRMSVLETKVDTILEIVRILFGLVIVQGLPLAIQFISWMSRRKTESLIVPAQK